MSVTGEQGYGELAAGKTFAVRTPYPRVPLQWVQTGELPVPGRDAGKSCPARIPTLPLRPPAGVCPCPPNPSRTTSMWPMSGTVSCVVMLTTTC